MSNPWIIDEADFYELDSHVEQMQFLLRYAILAPSGHNTQPWTFRITPEGVEVYADTSRALSIVDRSDRELLISIGTAITNLRVAAAHFGFDTTVAYEPGSLESRPLATVFMRETCAPNPDFAMNFPAIRQRHTNRETYDGQALEPAAAQAICDVLDANTETLRLILPRHKEHAAQCVEYAERVLISRPGYRAELADCVRETPERNDGLPPEALGIPSIFSEIAPWLIRNIDGGVVQGRRDAERIRTASMLLVVASDQDRISLIRAGETLEQLLLTITRLGLHYSFLSAPVELDETRERLRLLAGSTKEPQLLLRIGTARKTATATRRRPVESVIVA